MKAIVTVKLKRNPNHDPRNKKISRCPLVLLDGDISRPYPVGICTDTTGSHHSYIEEGKNIMDIKKKAKKKYGHVTRVEVIND